MTAGIIPLPVSGKIKSLDNARMPRFHRRHNMAQDLLAVVVGRVVADGVEVVCPSAWDVIQ